ncbi:tetratricopeptide repeat (TPR)-like superfamily protein [Actinidia rufa]|uniref:Tetratricopeptide repeat (TPR)-like superfamily protein n=1 Tax=Actinidia rufa TaxID=165716 RepID=A0A7J0FBG5_9ERIC|nr:tetratricopeptide repeat (TPR)-like superfamily protein [Actinidia rufa]
MAVVSSASASSRKVLPLLLKPISNSHLFPFSSINHYSTLPKPLVDQVTKAFHQENLNLLDPKIVSKLQSYQVEPILFHLRSKPSSAIRFFEWSENFLGFNHTLESYCGLVHVLLSKRLFDFARRVFDRMARKFGNLDVLSVLHKGFNSYGSNHSTVCSFLVENYCRIGMVDLSVEGEVEMGLNFHRAMIERRFVVDIIASKVGPKPSLVTFSTLISGYCKELRLEEAFNLYNLMRTMGIAPDLIIYSILIDGLFRVGKFEEGNHLLSAALDRGVKLDVVVFGSIGQWGRLPEACGIFGQIMKRGIEPSVCTYSSLIDGFCKWGNLKDGFDLYKDMVNKGHTPDVIVYCVLITALSKQGRMVDALNFFNEIETNKGCHEAIHPYGGGFLRMLLRIVLSLMDSANKKNPTAGLRIFELMLDNGVNPDITIYNVLINMFFKEGCLKNASELFRKVQECGPEPDIVTYNTVICGYCSLKMLDEGVQLYEEMKCGCIKPNAITFTILIDAFCKEGRMDDASFFFSTMLETGPEPNVVTYSCLIDVSYSILIDGLCKRGLVEEASVAFHCALDQNSLPDLVAYGILIRGYCKVGRLADAMMLYNRMLGDGILPDSFLQTALAEYCLQDDQEKTQVKK